MKENKKNKRYQSERKQINGLENTAGERETEGAAVQIYVTDKKKVRNAPLEEQAKKYKRCNT